MAVERVEDLDDIVHLVVTSGKITKDDYRDVVEPALDAVGDDGIRMLVDLPDEGMPHIDVKALGADLGTWWHHRGEYRRVAVVADGRFVRKLTDISSPLMKGQMKGFEPTERDAAIAWVRGDD